MQRITLMAGLTVCTLLSLGGCTTTQVDHKATPHDHTIEYFSFSSIEVLYPTTLSPQELLLIDRYHPGERVAERVRGFAEETRMWGGSQELVLGIRSIRLPDRWEWDAHGPLIVGSAVGHRGEDHFAVDVEIRQQEQLLHEMRIVRKLGSFDRELPQVFSSERAINDLIGDVAWQVVFEMTPPGYDQQIILIGHRDDVQPATLRAARRGLLDYDEILKASATGKFKGQDYDDLWCGASLAKPSWVAWWLWDPFTYKKCEKRAKEASRRMGGDN